MTTLHHPTIPDVTREVDEKDKDFFDRHLAQGWKKSEPAAAKKAREATEAAE